jgi:hypothetical protein
MFQSVFTNVQVTSSNVVNGYLSEVFSDGILFDSIEAHAVLMSHAVHFGASRRTSRRIFEMGEITSVHPDERQDESLKWAKSLQCIQMNVKTDL